MIGPLLGTLAACADEAGPPPCTDCVLTEGMNYHYEPTLAASVRPLPPLSDPRLVWDGLTRDLQGHAVDPADLDAANLLVFRDLTPEEVLDRVAHDRLDQSELRIIAACAPDTPACTLSDFALGSNRFDPSQYFEVGSGTWLVTVSRAGDAGAAALVFLAPTDGADPVEDVVLADGDSTLSVDVRFSDDRLRVEAGGAPSLDWSGLTTDALGNPASLSRFDRLYLARFDEELPVLTRDFLDLEQLAEEHWELDVAGRTTAALAELDGFGGVDAGHRWLLALRCSTCRNPAPRFVTVLEPVDVEQGR
jgi:hypothetical protein